MGFWKWADAKAGKIDAIDMGLVKISVFFLALALAVLWPPLLSLGWETYAAIFVLAAIKPTYDVLVKK